MLLTSRRTAHGAKMETVTFCAFCAMLDYVLSTIPALRSSYLSLRVRTITLRGFHIDLHSFSVLLDYSQRHINSVYSRIHSFTHAATVYRQ